NYKSQQGNSISLSGNYKSQQGNSISLSGNYKSQQGNSISWLPLSKSERDRIGSGILSRIFQFLRLRASKRLRFAVRGTQGPVVVSLVTARLLLQSHFLSYNPSEIGCGTPLNKDER